MAHARGRHIGHAHWPAPDLCEDYFSFVKTLSPLGNASSSTDSCLWSERIQAPVWTTSRSAVSGHGANVGSAASHGRSVKMWLRTSETGAKPAAARWELIAVAQRSLKRLAS